MKKLIFLIALLIVGLFATGQVDTTKMSNYEKYLLVKEKTVIPDTIVKYDTVYVEQEKPEYDDLYFQAKKDELKLKQKELRLERRKLNLLHDSLYYDAKQEVYNDLYNNIYFSDIRFRLYFGYRPYYHYWHWNPFWYDTWFYDPFYFNWRYPYSYWYNSPYYYWYNRPYYWHDWHYRPYFVNNYYGYNDFNTSRYGIINNKTNVPYGRRNGVSNLTVSNPRSVIVNKTVQVDRKSGQILNNQSGVQRRTLTERNLSVTSNGDRRSTISTTKTSPTQRPMYNQSERRSYTPSYTQPKISTRPQYNNTDINRRYNSNDTRYNYVMPGNRRTTETTSQSRTYSAPNRNSTLNQNRRTSSYSAPATRNSSYSSPKSSSRSSSTYSAPRRPANSYNSPSSVNRSNYGGSYSGGSFSGRSSNSSTSSSGRRK